MLRAISHAAAHSLNFAGRAGRAEFWWWTVFAALLILLALLVDVRISAPMMGYERFTRDVPTPAMIVMLFLLLTPTLAVSVRRLHDIGQPGWWVLINAIPLIGQIGLAFLFALPGAQGKNRYGMPVRIAP
ncbi:uncharacterized membrane protein YhaH (DUF805 family) [Rhodovulum iodosum]|uniref:Uncharacterized membrane protein YhaH (DUF805 family) n=1 Tax=Rhodovulum iodosum TaxID=68291 RepID=A0ABV3XP14_9RHOB|nr:DUF805 domain-containing protein [Rhodovulum robiginosum]